MLQKMADKIAGLMVWSRYLLRTAVNVLKLKPTYCRLLWENAFITPNGEVFNCCGYRPGKVGNIYQSSLGRIWSGSARLGIYRAMSLSRVLPCFHDCNILSRSEKKEGPATSVTSLRHPKKVWLLYGEACNVNCIMCPQDHHSRKRLDNEMLRSHIDWVQVEDVEMQGGEILAMESARKFYLWLTRDLGKKVNMITNGMLVDDEWASHLVRGGNWIQVSINAATKATHEAVNRKSDFDRVLANCARLIAAKRETGLPVTIIYKFTMVEENVHEIPDAVLLAERMGFDEIHFGYDHKVPRFLADNGALKEELQRRISECFGMGLNLTIERNRLEYLELVD